MTPEEKAKELIEKFIIGINFDSLISVRVAHQVKPKAKEVALICVDEIIKESSECFCYNDGSNEYWQEVKQEIKKL